MITRTRPILIALAALALILWIPAAVAGQDSKPTEESLLAAIAEARDSLRAQTPHGGRTPPEVLAEYAATLEAYLKHYPKTEQASQFRSLLLSCYGRMEDPQRMIDSVDAWLRSGVVDSSEYDRVLRSRFMAVEMLRGGESALAEIDEAIEQAREKHVRLLLAKSVLGATSEEARLAAIEEAIAAAGDSPSLRAEALASKALALMSVGGAENREKAQELFREASELDANAMAVNRARMSLRTRQQAVEGQGDIAPGNPAPVFALNNIRTGDEVKLTDFRGEYVLLDFWATWCGPCLRLMDVLLADLHRDYGDKGLNIIGIGTNWRGETAELQRAWADAKDEPVMRGSTRTRGECDWLKVHDPTNEVTQTYGVRGIPFVVLIDRQGKIVFAGTGHALAGDIREYLEKNLGRVEG